jgi:hypothetical protein
MSDLPSREYDAAAPTRGAESAINNYKESAKLAREKTTQCEKLLTFARFIRDQGEFALRSAGQHPSDEDKDGFRGLKQQWQDLLNDKMLYGAGEVLTEAFLDKAELELGKLNETDIAATQARVAWQKVMSLIEDCQEVKQEVDQVMAKMQSLLS